MITSSAIASSRFVNNKQINFSSSSRYGRAINPVYKNDTVGCFSFWFTPVQSSGSIVILSMGPYGSRPNISAWYLKQTSYGSNRYLNMAVRVDTGSSVTDIDSYFDTTSLSVGVRYHVVLQSNGSAYTCYIDNVLQNQVGSGAGEWLYSLAINKALGLNGVWYGVAAPLLGGSSKFDEIVYINRVLTTTEITNMYHGGVAINPLRIIPKVDIKTYLKCGDQNDTTSILYDRVGVDDVTLTGGPTIIDL